MTDLATNVLHHGDNLDILRRYLPDAAVATGAQVAARCEGLLATRGMIDFDRLMVLPADEFQDADAAHLDLVAALAEPERNPFVVGDGLLVVH